MEILIGGVTDGDTADEALACRKGPRRVRSVSSYQDDDNSMTANVEDLIAD